MRRRRRLFVLLLALSVLGGVRAAEAAVVLALDLAQMTRAATVVADIQVTSRASRRLGTGQIVTDLEAVVLEGIKGIEDGEQIALFTEGGIVDGVGASVPGEPRLRPGDRVVAFLEPAGAGLRFVGMSQGCLRVVDSARGPEVRPGGQGLALVRRTPGGLAPGRPALSGPRSLSSLLDEVRALAGR